MHRLRNAFRPVVEVLEDRCTPSGVVTGSFAHGVWTLTGDSSDNNITVNSTGKPGSFTVTGNSTPVTGVTNPTGVKAIVYDLGDGNDTVSMNTNSTPIRLNALTFLGGDGDNTLSANHLTVNTNLRVTNGTGFDDTELTDFKVKGSVFINDGDGGSSTAFFTDLSSVGFNSIGGNLTILNGTGADDVFISDTKVGGNIINNNGSGDGTNAGEFQMLNQNQTGARAVVGGNVRVTFADGTVSVNQLFDTHVKGSVTFNDGSGPCTSEFDGFVTPLPVKIDHNLTITGAGSNKIVVGESVQKIGMIVGGNLLIDLGQPASALELFKLVVHGTTTIE
jgi:hypothetical protein